MFFLVWTAQGDVIYKGGSWPMARAALDSVVLADKAHPQLTTCSEPQTEKEP